jgi:hypothetical protein
LLVENLEAGEWQNDVDSRTRAKKAVHLGEELQNTTYTLFGLYMCAEFTFQNMSNNLFK